MPYYYGYGFDWTYLVIVLPCIILSLWASSSVNSTFNKYSKVMSYRRISGDTYAVTAETTPVNEVANKIREVPALFINQAGNGITAEGLHYLLPLIQGEATPRYVCGLPYQLKI